MFKFKKTACMSCVLVVLVATGCETTDYEPVVFKAKLKEMDSEIAELKAQVSALKKTLELHPSSVKGATAPSIPSVESTATLLRNNGTAIKPPQPESVTLSAAAEKLIRDELENLEVFFRLDDSGFAIEADLMECRTGDEALAKMTKFPRLSKVICNGPMATPATYELLAEISGLSHLELERSTPDAASLEKLKSLPDLKFIQLYTATLTEDSMRVLSEFPALEQIRCAKTRVGDKELEHLGNLTSLRAIDLSDCNRVSNVGLESLARCPKLQFLKVWGQSIDDTSMDIVASMKSLKVLGLNDTGVTDAGIKKLLGLDLVEVHLFRTSVGDEGVRVLSQMPNLATVNLRDTKVTDFGVGYLSKLKKLKKLDLSECPSPRITDESGKSLAQISSLVQLNLWNTNFSDEGVKHLSWLSNLTWLNLDNTKITDDTVAMLNEMPQLTWLHLGKTNITDREVNVLAGLANLRYLNLSHTKISEDAFYKLDDVISPKGGVVIGP